MTRTPDEIKRELVTCLELVVPRRVQHEAIQHALALIQQLEEWNKSMRENNDKLLALDGELHKELLEQRERADKLEAERDALFKYVCGRCYACKYYNTDPYEEPCDSCVVLDGNSHNWEWCGAQKNDDTDEMMEE